MQNTKTIGQLFDENQYQIRGIFNKWGISQDTPATPAMAGHAYKALGPAFARDMAEVIYPEHVGYSNTDGDDDKASEAIETTGAILGGLASMAPALAHVFHKKNGGQPPLQLPPPSGNQSQPDKKEIKETLYFGLKPIHIGGIFFLIVLVVLFVAMGDDKKKGSSSLAGNGGAAVGNGFQYANAMALPA